MSSRWIWVVVSAAVVFGVFTFAKRGTAPRLANGNSLEADIADLQRSVVALRRERGATLDAEAIRALDRKVAEFELRQSALRQSAAVPSSIPATSAPEAAGPPPNMSELIARQQAHNAQRAEEIGTELDSFLATERVDASWRNETLAAVQRTFATLTSDKILTADCGARLCRLELQHDSSLDQRNLARDIAGQSPFDQEVIYRYDYTSRPPRTVLYVARAGTSLLDLVSVDQSKSSGAL